MAQNSGAGEWDPVTVGHAIVVDLHTVRWALSAAPDTDWIAAFRNAPMTKSGSMEYVTTGSEPKVAGHEIEWKVGPKDHLDANIQVRQKVDAANAAYPVVLARRAEARDRAAVKKQGDEDAIKEAQRLLDEASGDAG
jgi:hypothetical protein